MIPSLLAIQNKHKHMLRAEKMQKFEEAATLRDELLDLMFRRFCYHIEALCDSLGVGFSKVTADQI